MGNIIKLAAVLTVVTAIAGLAVSLVYSKTKDQIELRKQENLQQSLQSVFPGGVSLEEAGGDSLPLYWKARRGDTLVGYAFKDSASGYSSYIKVVVGVSPQGKIIGVSVLSQNETPGLGTRVEEVLSDKYIWNGLLSETETKDPWFTAQFEGIDITEPVSVRTTGEWHTLDSAKRAEWRQENKISAITGATISTNAVVTAVCSNIPSYINALIHAQTAGQDTLPDATTGVHDTIPQATQE